jgi:leucyl-tRNA synthetase
MSKSRGNVINPDDIIAEYGADSMRIYEMFMGPLEVSKPWATAGLVGVSRFLERLWTLSGMVDPADPAASINDDLRRLMHRTIKKVSLDTASLNFNTAISQMMIYSGSLAKLPSVPAALWEPLVLMISVYAPHLGEELWEKLGRGGSVSRAVWPVWDEAETQDQNVTIVVQVNGKIRDKFIVRSGAPKEELEQTALALPLVQKWLEGREIVRIISVPDKLVNVAVSPPLGVL